MNKDMWENTHDSIDYIAKATEGPLTGKGGYSIQWSHQRHSAGAAVNEGSHTHQPG
jgi:hypothetical protein